MTTDKKVEMSGWVLFVISSLFYIASNLASGQILSLAGSVFFMVACGVFIFLRLQQRD